MNSVMIVAAEASSALFAQRLLEHWKAEGEDVQAFGVGTQDMEKLGFERLGKSEEMAVIGITEIVSKYSFLKSVFDKLVAEAALRKPKVAIVMDYPEFNLMLSKKLHAMGIPVVYYVSPQVWAWRKGRVETIKKYCQNVFLLFPFEVDFYKERNVPHEFIGHPLLDEVSLELEDPKWRLLRRQQCGFQDDDLVVGLMPGSRRQELKNVFPIQLEAAKLLCRKHPKVKILILTAPTIERDHLLPYLEDVRIPYVVMKDDPAKMIAITDYVMATSGTATLFVGLLKKPMIIMYKVTWLTAVIGRLIVPGFFGLPNLILGRAVVPELFQWDCTPERAFQEMDRYLSDPDYDRKTRDSLGEVLTRLGNRGATKRVAAALKKYLDPVK
ncbi:MAG: lipid-A-disaccharide synthase [Bdellovibrionaceae bacterium]|nr:lipid-A-disaccharide synthase [Pseudobdellovibrionaceae bacterium]